MLVVGLLQVRGGDVGGFARLAGRVRSADLVVLPEFSNGLPGGRVVPLGEWVELLEGLAVERGVYVVAGVLEEAGGCRYSSVVLVEPSGSWRVVYRKRVLFRGFGVDESRLLCPGGGESPVVRLGGLGLGFLVCYELRLPELARRLAARGVEVIVAPSAWYPGPLKEEHFTLVSRARALDNTVWVVAVNQPAPSFTGRSLVVDPMGLVRLQLPPGPGYGEVEVDEGAVREAREALPVLRDALMLTGGRL